MPCRHAPDSVSWRLGPKQAPVRGGRASGLAGGRLPLDRGVPFTGRTRRAVKPPTQSAASPRPDSESGVLSIARAIGPAPARCRPYLTPNRDVVRCHRRGLPHNGQRDEPAGGTTGSTGRLLQAGGASRGVGESRRRGDADADGGSQGRRSSAVQTLARCPGFGDGRGRRPGRTCRPGKPPAGSDHDPPTPARRTAATVRGNQLATSWVAVAPAGAARALRVGGVGWCRPRNP